MLKGPLYQVAQNRATKECNELVNEEAKLRRELGAQLATCAQLTSDKQISAATVKSVEGSLAAAKAENSKMSRTVDSLTAKLRLTEEKRTSLEQSNEEQRSVHLQKIFVTAGHAHLGGGGGG